MGGWGEVGQVSRTISLINNGQLLKFMDFEYVQPNVHACVGVHSVCMYIKPVLKLIVIKATMIRTCALGWPGHMTSLCDNPGQSTYTVKS